MTKVSWRYAQMIMWPMMRDAAAQNMQAVRWLLLRKVDDTSVCYGSTRKMRSERTSVRAKRKCVRHQQSAVLCGLSYL